MAAQVTIEELRQLLLDLGFAKAQRVANNHRGLRHQGHLPEAAFDYYVAEGKLPAA